MFWEIIRPKFSNKCKTAKTIFLVENEKIIRGEKAIANTFSNYFTDVTHCLCLKKENIGLENTFSKIVKKIQKLREYKEY